MKPPVWPVKGKKKDAPPVPKRETVDLSTKSCLIVDKGQNIHIARRLGRDFGEVLYYYKEEEGFSRKSQDDIGRGFDEFTVTGSYRKALDKVDMIVFPDCYNSDEAVELHDEGHNVFAALGSEQIEVDRLLQREILKAAGLPVSPAVFITDDKDRAARAEGAGMKYIGGGGLPAAWEYLKGKENKYLKFPWYRGDAETYPFKNAFRSGEWFVQKRAKIGGQTSQTIEIIIEDPIESECETGFDTPAMLDGRLPKNLMIGCEDKGKAYGAMIVERLPEVLADMHTKMAGDFKRLGYQGAYSCETRIDPKGRPFYIDATCRFPSPPSELGCEMWTNLSLAMWHLAHGELIDLEYKYQYGAQINLSSDWYNHHSLAVQYPKGIDQNIKLKNVQRQKDGDYLIVNELDGYMGGAIGMADDLDEAMEIALDNARQVQGEDVEFDEGAFERIRASAEAGERFGIEF